MTTTKRPIFRWPLLTIGGVLVIILYITFTFISWGFYPESFGPATHYLSRLGNFNYSPFGAYFYNLGCILTGIAIFPFYIGFYQWYTDRLYQKVPLILGQVVGLCSAVALIMIGVFSEDQGSPHMVASSTFFLLNFIVLILVNLALLLNSEFWKLIAVYGLAIDFLTLGLQLAIGGPLVEWFTVFGSLLFVGLVSLNTQVLTRGHQEE
ncbi:MAG: DUF998 domain-containing protein [Candidatus Thorarchaeota archaeon]|jgi:hypothetical membrane protein